MDTLLANKQDLQICGLLRQGEYAIYLHG